MAKGKTNAKARADRAEPSTENSSATQNQSRTLAKPEQRVPSHGRGKLNKGGTPGHRGAGGRPKDELRALWSKLGVDFVNHIAHLSPKEFTPGQAVYVADVASKYSLPTRIEVLRDDSEVMDALPNCIAAVVADLDDGEDRIRRFFALLNRAMTRGDAGVIDAEVIGEEPRDLA